MAGNMDEQMKLDRLEKIIDYKFQDSIGLKAIEAINTSGMPFIFRGQQFELRTNKELALFGGTMCTAQLCILWFDSERPASDWDNLRKSLTDKMNKARIGAKVGLDACVIRNPGSFGSVSPNNMAMTLDAVLAVVFIDGGWEALRRVMDRLGLTTHVVLD